MTKRIIDSMTADQIITGWDSSQKDVAEYIESICKPEPNWSDDASADNPILCWVSEIPLPEADCTLLSRVVDRVSGIDEEGYMVVSGFHWKYARPISPDECWKPTEQGESDEEFKARKKENIKLNEEAQALLAFYRKELKKLSDGMRNA